MNVKIQLNFAGFR
ncbi:hypothetical protein HF086_002547 [Spodoptera exigua]|uniref:Uncharacterized protein n=1 Tax=Spodoptera exigua TaxID=7107 RepID=A0A922S951_SPOEX|nr:hypothetical protein HF086_002547 [Spodoptera exigua]